MIRANVFVLVFVFGLALAGCKQSAHDGWQIVCDAPTECCKGEPDSPERAVKIAKWMFDHVTNEAVRKELSSLASVEGVNKLAIVRAGVREAGVDDSTCTMLKEWHP